MGERYLPSNEEPRPSTPSSTRVPFEWASVSDPIDRQAAQPPRQSTATNSQRQRTVSRSVLDCISPDRSHLQPRFVRNRGSLRGGRRGRAATRAHPRRCGAGVLSWSDSSRIPARSAMTAAASLVRAFMVRMAFLRCVSTVYVEIASRAAASVSESPAAIERRTSRSRPPRLAHSLMARSSGERTRDWKISVVACSTVKIAHHQTEWLSERRVLSTGPLKRSGVTPLRRRPLKWIDPLSDRRGKGRTAGPAADPAQQLARRHRSGDGEALDLLDADGAKPVAGF